MDPASAAAVASTPSIKGGVTLDAFDARIVEYQAAVRKLEALVTQVKAVNIKVRSQPGTVPLVHYIVALSGPWVGGASEVLKRRLDQVSRLEVVTDSRKTTPAVTTMAIPFDVDEQNEIRAPDYQSGDVDHTLVLQGLLSIFENSLSIYQSKLKQCILERDAYRRPDANHKPVPLDLSSFKDILEPTELNNLSKLVSLKTELATAPFKTTPFLLDSINTTIDNINKYHAELLNYKKKASEGILKRLPAWQNTNHRIFACFVKLGELYNILRKVGRDLYLPVSDDLHSAKILHNNVKLEVSLNSCDEFFKAARRNEQIVFTLTRASRQGSYLHLKRDVILSFVSPLEQSILLDKRLVEVVSDFLKNWELADAKEKRAKQRLQAQAISEASPTPSSSQTTENKRLSILFNPDREKQSKEAIAKQQRERERVMTDERAERERAEKERQTVQDIKSKRRIEARERELRDELIKDRSPSVSRNGSLLRTRQRSDSNASTSSASNFGPPPVVTRHRSGSNASTTSNSSNSSVLNSMRDPSLPSVPVARSPSAISRSPSLQTRRPASVYMSSPAFDIRSEIRRQEKAKAAAAAAAASSPPSGLKRTPSLPTSHQPRPSSQLTATAGAASALKFGRQETQERSSSLKTQAELRQHRQMLSTTGTQNHLRAPIKQLSDQPQELPDIGELSIHSSNMRTPPRPTGSKLSTPEVTTKLVNEITPKSYSIIEEEPYISSNIQDSPTKSPSPGLKSSLKSPKTLDPGPSAPELSHTTETASTESSISFEPHFDEESDGRTLTIISETQEQTTPIKIIKKVRFIGVPDQVEEDPKPKKKGWIHPPKILLRNNNNNKPQTSLSFAAQALVQQERVTFSNIKRGQFDMKTGKVIYPDQKSTRIMNTLGNGGSTPSPKGKWSIGGRLKDRFA